MRGVASIPPRLILSKHAPHRRLKRSSTQDCHRHADSEAVATGYLFSNGHRLPLLKWLLPGGRPLYMPNRAQVQGVSAFSLRLVIGKASEATWDLFARRTLCRNALPSQSTDAKAAFAGTNLSSLPTQDDTLQTAHKRLSVVASVQASK